MATDPTIHSATALTLPPIQQLAMSPQQLEQLLMAVRHYSVATFEARHQLDESQERAKDSFENAAAGLAVSRFLKLAPLLKREGCEIRIEIPTGAVVAVVYSQKGAQTLRLDKCSGSVVVSDDPHDRVGRVDFLDGNGALVFVTGGEVPKKEDNNVTKVV